jgi:hypothetical protein
MIDRRNQRAVAEEQWILGFLAGSADAFASHDPSNGIDPLNGTDHEGVWAWIDNYCRDHPIEQMVSAGEAFIRAHPR